MKKYEELNTILNSFEERMTGHHKERQAIICLDIMGQLIGYGRLEQLARDLKNIQLYDDVEDAINNKREQFQSLSWQLPKDFPE